MSARRIARELAVIVFPQLPKDGGKLENVELNELVGRAVSMLSDYARQNLADAQGLLRQVTEAMTGVEIDHPNNADMVEELVPVPVTTQQVREQVELLDRAAQLVAEALDIPEMFARLGHATVRSMCRRCDAPVEHRLESPDRSQVKEYLRTLVCAYMEHRQQIDEFIRQAKSKWRVERMVSIDRDILRLACAEAFFLPEVPINVCISEAVELSRRFADERAARFINGVLADLSGMAARFRKSGVMEELQPAGPTGDDTVILTS